jgi:hypothetical protein
MTIGLSRLPIVIIPPPALGIQTKSHAPAHGPCGRHAVAVARPEGRGRAEIGFVCTIGPRPGGPRRVSHCRSVPSPQCCHLGRRSGATIEELGLFSAIGRRAGIGFVLPRPIGCAINHNSFPAKPLPVLTPGREWALFVQMIRRSRRTDRRIGFVWQNCPARSPLPPGYPNSPKFGFVCHIPPSTPPADWRNWFCLAESPWGWNGGMMEYWNNGGSRRPPRLELGLFGAIGSSHGPACPSGGGKLGLFVRRASSRPGGIGFVCTTPLVPQAPTHPVPASPIGFVSRSGASRRCRRFSRKKREDAKETCSPAALGWGERITPGGGGATRLLLPFFVFQIINHNS